MSHISKLVDQTRINRQQRTQFLVVAASMRRILIDQAWAAACEARGRKTRSALPVATRLLAFHPMQLDKTVARICFERSAVKTV